MKKILQIFLNIERNKKMRERLKCIFSVFLALAMILSVIPAYAADGNARVLETEDTAEESVENASAEEAEALSDEALQDETVQDETVPGGNDGQTADILLNETGTDGDFQSVNVTAYADGTCDTDFRIYFYEYDGTVPDDPAAWESFFTDPFKAVNIGGMMDGTVAISAETDGIETEAAACLHETENTVYLEFMLPAGGTVNTDLLIGTDLDDGAHVMLKAEAGGETKDYLPVAFESVKKDETEETVTEKDGTVAGMNVEGTVQDETEDAETAELAYEDDDEFDPMETEEETEDIDDEFEPLETYDAKAYAGSDAFAVYCQDDQSLTFAYGAVPEEGGEYEGKTVTDVYTGFGTKEFSGKGSAPWNGIREDIESVVFEESYSTVEPTKTQWYFTDCTNLKSIDLTGLNTGRVTNMQYMFQNCSSLESIDLSPLDLSNATSFYGLFENCTGLKSIDLTGVTTSKVTNWHTAFAGCSALEELDVSGLDMSAATQMYGMFDGCSALRFLDLSGWNTSGIGADGVYCNHFLTDCDALECLVLGTGFDLFEKSTGALVPIMEWYDSDINGEVVSDNYLIGLCDDITVYSSTSPEPIAVGDLGAFAFYDADDESLMFAYDVVPEAGSTYNGKTVSEVYTGLESASFSSASAVPWYSVRRDVKNVIIDASFAGVKPVSLAYWFYYMDQAVFTGLENIDASNVTSLNYAFGTCKNLTSFDGMKDWDVSNVTKMDHALYSTGAVTADGLENWDTSRVTTFNNLFGDSQNLTSVDALKNWDVSKVTNMFGLFQNDGELTSIKGIAGWDVSGVETMTYLFKNCGSLTSIEALADWNTASLTDMSYMFQNCYSLVSADGLDGWDTSHAETVDYLFESCTSLASIEALKNWDVTSLSTLQYVFQNCTALTSVSGLENWDVSGISRLFCTFKNCSALASLEPLSGWGVSNVTTFYDAFYGCGSVGELSPLSGWDVSGATNFCEMFSHCSSLKSADGLENWDTSKVTNMQSMFNECGELESMEPIKDWDMSANTTLYSFFYKCRSLTDIDISSWDTSKVTNMQYMFYGCDSLTTIYSDDDVFVTDKVTSGSNMFLYSPMLVGGIGTEYDGSRVSFNEAHVDKTGNPGYFTEVTEKETGHDYVSEVTKEETCTEDGIMTYTCTICGDTYTEVIPAAGHTAVTDEAVAATCTEDGMTEGSHCSVCGEIIKARETVKALGHDYADSITTEASCTKDGVMTYTCSRCGDVYTENIPATGHTEVKDKAVSATCTKTGLTEGSHCSICGTVIKKQETTAKLGHNYKWVMDKKADYGIKGSRHQECTRCGAKGKTESIAAKSVGRLYPQVKSVKKTSQKISWNSVKGATKYVVYGSKCGSSYKKLATVKGTSWTHKKLKSGTYYKYYVVAYNGSTQIKKSYTIHSCTKGGRYGNPTTPAVKKTNLTVKAGKTVKMNASYKSSGSVKKHASKLRYYSSDTSVAKVNSSGKITGIKKGSCTIYAVAQNGKKTKVKVTVK